MGENKYTLVENGVFVCVKQSSERWVGFLNYLNAFEQILTDLN